jgi:hypothetical protein
VIDHGHSDHLATQARRVVIDLETEALIDRNGPLSRIEREYMGTCAALAILAQTIPQLSGDTPALVARTHEQMNDVTVVTHRGHTNQRASREGQMEAQISLHALPDGPRTQ